MQSVMVTAIFGQLVVSASGTDAALTERVFSAAQALAVSAAAPQVDSSAHPQRIGFSLEQPWKQWAGSLDDLARAARLAVDDLTGWDPNAEDTHGWGVETEITVIERRGVTTTLADPAELPSAVDPRDLANVKRVVIDVNRLRPRSRVTVIADATFPHNGTDVTVGGQDRTRVEGLMSRLRDVLAPRERLGLLLTRFWWLVASTWTFLVSFVCVALLLKYAFGVEPQLRLAVAAAAGIALALVAGLLALASPTLEVLPPGGKPRFQRWRAKLLAAVGALVLGVIGSVIATAIYSGD